MNTFRRNIQLATLDNLDLVDRLVAAAGGTVLNLVDDLVALEDLTEDDVATIEPTMQ